MDTQGIWQSLGGISIGTAAAWIVVISTIVVAVVAGVLKLYRLFSKFNDIKEKDEERQERLAKHDETLAQINEILKEINSKLDIQGQMLFDQMKHEIVVAATNAINNGEINAETYRTLSEMYEIYADTFHQNGYVKSLMKRMKDVKIIGEIEL